MDSKNVIELVEELEENLEDLEDSLSSILAGSLATTSKKLPLLDRAKLNVLLVYSIESLLFSYLKLHDVQVKEHPVFKELTRVKQYFEKIKTAEAGVSQAALPVLTLNKDAAARVVRHGLAGNEKYDLERAEREAREKFLANRRLKTLEAKMREEAAQNQTSGPDTDMQGVLVHAAELAAVPPDAQGDGAPDPGSKDHTDSDEEGEIIEEQTGSAQPPQAELQQGKKRQSKANSKTRRAKRKRETGFSDAMNEQQMAKALAKQAGRKASLQGKKKAKKASRGAPPAP